MKKIIILVLCTIVSVVSCSKFDDSKIWEELEKHNGRITLLEELCRKLNSDVINIQTIVTALETNDYIVNASPLATGDGYTLIFKSGKSIVIYNGKDGLDGNDGVTPQIGVKKDTDGVYYWTIDGEWLIVNGEKVKASASDGENGVDGRDGVTPQFKIVDGHWYISYNNGETWEMLGKATGDDGLVGESGDSFFKSVSIEDGFVVFILNDGNDTVIKLPLQKATMLEIELKDAGTLRSFISSEEARVTTKLKIKGKINNDDMRFIQLFSALIELDLSETEFYEYGNEYRNSVFYLNPYMSELVNRTLNKVWLPRYEYISVNYSYCSNLEHIVVPSQERYGWYSTPFDNVHFSLCPMLSIIEYSEGIKEVPMDDSMKVNDRGSITYYTTNSKYSTMILPSTTELVAPDFLRNDLKISIGSFTYDMYDFVVICKAITPPTVERGVSNGVYNYINCTLYVPLESVDLYKEHPTWGQFDVVPIEEWKKF